MTRREATASRPQHSFILLKLRCATARKDSHGIYIQNDGVDSKGLDLQHRPRYCGESAHHMRTTQEEDQPGVLVVDSDTARSQSLESVLVDSHRVTIVDEREAALQELSRASYDLVLLDADFVGPPDEVILSELRHSTGLPFVLMIDADVESAPSIWERAFEVGASDVLRFPSSNAEIQARVAAAVRRTRSQHDSAESLRRETSRLRMALDAARMLAIEWDLTADSITLSDNATEILGPLPPSIFNNSDEAFKLVHPDDVDELRATLDDAIENRSDFQVQFRVIRPDNQQAVWIEEKGYIVADQSGQATRLIAVAVDVTSRKEAETALQEREQYLRAIFDATPECIKIVTSDGTLRQMNAAGLAMIEASSGQEVIEKNVCELIAPEYRQEYAEFNERVCAGNGGILQFDVIGLQGTRRHMETHAVPLQLRDGEAVQLAVTRDISEQKRAEILLRKSEEHFRRMADNAPTMLWVTDENDNCTFLSRGWYEFTGQREEEGLGDGWLNAIHPEDRERAGRIFLEASRKRESFSIDYRLRRNDGVYRATIDSGRPMTGDDGRFEGFIGSVIDVHERKQAEEFRAGQTRILEMIAGEQPLTKILAELVTNVERRIPNSLGSILLADADGQHLIYGAAPQLPESYNEAVNHIPIGPDIGSCGTAAFRRKPVIVTDIQQDPLWKNFSHIAKAHGLCACWSQPILTSDGALLGTFAIYFRTTRTPANDELMSLEEFARFASLAIERPRAQAALRESERRFRALTSATSDVIYRVNADWSELRSLDGRGFLVDTTRPRQFWLDAYIHPEDQASFVVAAEKAVLEKSVFELEHRVIRIDGQLGWIINRAVPILDDSGVVVEWFGAATDVTERKQTEQLQQRVTQTLSAMIEQSPLGIYLIDSDFRIVQVSIGAMPAFQNVQPIIGRDFEEVMHTIWPEHFADEAVRIFRHTLETGESYVSPGLTEKRKDLNEIQSYEWQLNRITLADGSFGVVCYFFETTRLQQAAAALRESEERFRMLADNMSQLAWTCGELGDCNWYNQRWYEYTGATFEEMQGHGWKSMHHPDHIGRVEASIARARQSGEVWEDTFPLKGKDGSYRWFLSRAVPIRNDDGEIIRWFGTNTDVNELRVTQQLLREADRRKDEFLAMLAHELRNPLAPIRSGLDILSFADDAEHRDVVRVMQEQVTHVVRLVDDLLDMSRIMRGKVELRKESIELQPTVRKAIDALADTIEQHGHRLSVSLPAEPVWLHADPVRIVQVLENLLNNATKYMEGNGVIELVATQIDGTLTIRVRDEGIGIDREFLPKVFELFAQSDRSLDRSKGGLGIGLTLVKQLIDMHGGTVCVESEGLGHGSVFSITLPVVAPPDAVPEPSALPADHTQAYRIVVVDDNRGAVFLLSRLLTKIGDHEVHTASDGDAALEVIRKVNPDVVFLDIGLPKLSGYEVASEIRKDHRFDGLLLIALTGYGQEQDRVKSQDAGFDMHLVKPPSIDQMRFALSHPKLMEASGKPRGH